MFTIKNFSLLLGLCFGLIMYLVCKIFGPDLIDGSIFRWLKSFFKKGE